MLVKNRNFGLKLNFGQKSKLPQKIHLGAHKRTGDQFWSRTGRAIRVIFWYFLGRVIFFKEKLDGRQIFVPKNVFSGRDICFECMLRLYIQ